MLSKCDHSGVFKVNLRSFTGQLEVKLTSTTALEHFNKGKDRIRQISENLWYIEDFIVYQYGTTLNLNNRLHESIANALAKQKIELTSIRGLLDLKDRVKDKVIINNSNKNNNHKVYKGVRIDKNQNLVFFEDGSSQELGPDQKMMLDRGELSPQSVIKTKSY